MAAKEQTRRNRKAISKQRAPQSQAQHRDTSIPQTQLATVIQRASLDPHTLTPPDIPLLQRAIGNQAVGQLLAESGDQASPQRVPQSHPVQRIMSVDTFKKKTTLVGESLFGRTRNNVNPVETALQTYIGIAPPITGANTVAKRQALTDIITACDTYLGSGTAKRKSGVRKLKNEAQKEQTVLTPLAESLATADNAVKFEKVAQAQDAQIDLIRQGHLSDSTRLFNPNTWIMPVLTALRTDPVAMHNVIEGEINKLTAIKDDPQTLPLTRQILQEILANRANITTTEAQGNPETKLRTPGDFTAGYEVGHMLQAPGGSAERLGSLAHEFTHASVANSFRNSDLYAMAFQVGTPDATIVALSAKRTRQLEELETLMETEKFTDDQKNLLRAKLQYPNPAKDARGYLQRYIKPNIIPNAAARARVQALANSGVNNTVIEFDTVINQMMLYMQIWGIPTNNKFYKRLKAVAQEAYNYRAAARP